MNRCFTILLGVCFLSAFSLTAVAQISIEASDLNYVPGKDVVARMSPNDFEVGPGGAGADQSWDFSEIELDIDYIQNLVAPAGQPGCETFPTANVCWRVDYGQYGIVLGYMELQEQYLDYLGMASYNPVFDTTIAVAVELEGHGYNFPIEYQDSWDSVIITNMDGDIETDSIHCEIDAYGTITDIAGTFNCLRMYKYTFTTSEEGEEVYTEEEHEYIWIVPGWGEIFHMTLVDDEENRDEPMWECVRVVEIRDSESVEDNYAVLPSNSSLCVAYPNPFNSTTTLNFSVTNSGNVNIAVFDLNGRMVSQLVNGFYTPGNFQTSFNALDLNSGQYFVKYSSGNATQTQPIMLMK